MNSEAVREMTFEEEYEVLENESKRVFTSEKEGYEPPLANCVLRRALRCIRKLQEQQPKTDWISCEERLPSEKEYYLITSRSEIRRIFYWNGEYWKNENFDITDNVVSMATTSRIIQERRCRVMGNLETFNKREYVESQCQCEKPKSNADAIRNMSDEELATFLRQAVYYCRGRQDNTKCEDCPLIDCRGCNNILIGEWLQAEVKEGNTNENT